MENQLYDLVIIGGGPAGYSAALYASRGMLNTLVIESYSVSSQVIITDHIENYPGMPDGVNGFDLIELFKKQVKKFDTELTEGLVENISQTELNGKKIWSVKTSKKTFQTQAVIIATGAKARELGIPGEKEFRGRGVSYCAVCDGAFFKEKKVMVIGGGDTAIQEAIYLTKFANKVIVVHRRDELRAEKILQDRAFNNPKIDFIWDSVASEIKGDQKVSSIILKNIKKSEVSEVPCEGVFIFVGFTPNTNICNNLISLDDTGCVITDQLMKTDQPGIFAAGDCRAESYRQIITACGDGAAAALSAEHYITSNKH